MTQVNLDHHVAREIMGTIMVDSPFGVTQDEYVQLPDQSLILLGFWHPTKNTDQAFLVVKKMEELFGLRFILYVEDGEYNAVFERENPIMLPTGVVPYYINSVEASEYRETQASDKRDAGRAICLAALEAVEKKI